MNFAQQAITVDLENHVCCECGTPYAIPARIGEQRRRDGNSFYCPNGHAQCYKNTTEDVLRRQLEAEKKQRTWAEERAKNAQESAERSERSRRATAAHLTRMKKRVAHGVCPHCNRTFQNVARHMASKHPGCGA